MTTQKSKSLTSCCRNSYRVYAPAGKLSEYLSTKRYTIADKKWKVLVYFLADFKLLICLKSQTASYNEEAIICKYFRLHECAAIIREISVPVGFRFSFCVLMAAMWLASCFLGFCLILSSTIGLWLSRFDTELILYWLTFKQNLNVEMSFRVYLFLPKGHCQWNGFN